MFVYQKKLQYPINVKIPIHVWLPLSSHSTAARTANWGPLFAI